MTNSLPQEILDIRGSFINHPEQRKNIIKSKTPIGDPPKCLNKDEKLIWYEMIDINPPGILVSSDRMTLEIVCRFIAKNRRGEALSGPELGGMLKILGSFGMSPSDRSKVSAGPTKDVNPFTEFTIVQ